MCRTSGIISKNYACNNLHEFPAPFPAALRKKIIGSAIAETFCVVHVGMAVILTPMSSERRRHERYAIWFPVQVVVEGEESTAVTFDASLSGLRVSSAVRLEVDTIVTLSFRVPPDSAETRQVQGKIIRVEPNTDDPDGFWRHRLAIQFLEAIPELESVLRTSQRLEVEEPSA